MPDGSNSASEQGIETVENNQAISAVKVVNGLNAVSAADWDAAAGSDDPFVSSAFLAALEDSGAVGAKSGWLPHHLVAVDDTDRVLGCAPLYLKSHSYGEYVFDWSWADAYERAGGTYYPKFQCGVPFTPVTGRRLLVRDDAPPETADVLASALVQLAEETRVSSVHVTFATEAECERFRTLGLLIRHGQQFHWANASYGSFDDFLGDLASRKRKAIRKERREVADCGVKIRALSGRDIEERHWDAFCAFYHDTHARKWGQAYLNRWFFSLLGERLGERVVLMLAEDGSGTPVAGALNLRGHDALYGRYWGCLDSFKFLHFEACYYRAIDYAIEQGLARVEAGAQGPHKVQRGYLPVRTLSAHWIRDPGFRAGVARFLDHERPAVAAEMAALSDQSPFRKDGEPGE